MEWVKLGDVGKIITGNTPSKKNKSYYDSPDINFVSPGDIVENNRINELTKSENHISFSAREKARIVSKNSILVTCIGIIGKVAKVKINEVAFNQQINAIVVDENKYDIDYVAYAIMANKRKLSSIANAAVVPLLNKSQFSDFKIFIDKSLEKQKDVSSCLNKIEKLIQTRQDQIQALDDLVESTFYDSFGIYISNKDNTVGLKDITSHISSGSTPRGGSNVYLSEGIPIIRSQDVLMNKLDLTNVAYISEETHNSMRRSKLKNKDILLNITGASIGRTAVFNGEDDSANTNQHVASIRLSTKEFLPEFISYYFSTDYFQSLIKNICSGGTREALNYTQIGMFKIPNVDIEKQNLFAAFVEKIEGQKEILNRSLEELRDLFDSLMQDAFDGSMVK